MGLGNNNGSVVFNKVTFLEDMEAIVEEEASAFLNKKVTLKDIAKITSIKDLVAIAKNETNEPAICCAAAGKLVGKGQKGQKALEKIMETAGTTLRYFIVPHLKNVDVLKKLVREDPKQDVVMAVESRLMKLSNFVPTVLTGESSNPPTFDPLKM